MKKPLNLGDILLPERPIRRLGAALIVVGVLLPFSVVTWCAVTWQPEIEREEAQSLGIEMIALPTGRFMMGSPEDEPDRDGDETLHEVVITRRFALSRTEISQGQYFEVMGDRPVDTTTDIFDDVCSRAGVGDDLPVVCVDWLKVVRFCNELSRREGLELAYTILGADVRWNREAVGYRLPTEAEWEYAARAGTRQRWVGTDDKAEVCEYANVYDSVFPCEDGYEALAPVDAKLANRWLLHGLGGNALEWVWDYYEAYPTGPVADPSGPEQASYRVIRGGSWWVIPRSARVAGRSWDEPSDRLGYLGFRVARSLPSDL
ncbi:MAG: formylglycine-generating enzyme family protein [Acidobacteriota bacterium]